MNVLDTNFQKHPVFEELASDIEFYDDLSLAVFSWVTQGTQALTNIDTYIFSSLAGTLDSIQLVLLNGRINDAWALLRKYYDSTVINVYSAAYLKNNFGIENFVVEKINDWLQGKSQLPEFRVMSKYIRECQWLQNVNKILLEKDKRYFDIRKRCNDHVHYNFYAHVMLNDKQIYIKNRTKFLDLFLQDMKDIFFMHISYIFFINQHYMASTDYVDYLDCGKNPPEGCQYWVAPFVQKVINRMKDYRPDIVDFLRSETDMELE